MQALFRNSSERSPNSSQISNISSKTTWKSRSTLSTCNGETFSNIFQSPKSPPRTWSCGLQRDYKFRRNVTLRFEDMHRSRWLKTTCKVKIRIVDSYLTWYWVKRKSWSSDCGVSGIYFCLKKQCVYWALRTRDEKNKTNLAQNWKERKISATRNKTMHCDDERPQFPSSAFS